MLRRAVLLLTAMVIAGALIAAPARAQVSPPGCNVNGLNLTLAKSGLIFRQGDTVTFTIFADNVNPPQPAGAIACDVTGATIGFNPPNPDGSENQDVNAPTAITVATNQNFLNPFQYKLVATFPWVVNLNPDVTSALGLAVVHGTVHDLAVPRAFAKIGKDLGFEVTNPKLAITKVGSIQSGQAPQNVTYTYVVTNTSTTPVPMNNVKVTDDKCANPTYVGGDNGDSLLSNGESWTFTCTSLLQAAGVYTNTASACANSTVPGDTTRPVCSPPATWTVTLTAPPQPKGGVKAASACVSVASTHLKVRAREINTVRVRVRVNGRNIAKSKVRIVGPAGLKRTGVTNKKGMVTFRVRPKKSGRLTITSDKCSVKARVSVKPARRVVAPALPEVTG
jgi:uncharacterized repeat protein (TIGR01451 family)